MTSDDRPYLMNTQQRSDGVQTGIPLVSAPPIAPSIYSFDRQHSTVSAPYVLVQTPAGLMPSLAVSPGSPQEPVPLFPTIQAPPSIAMSPGASSVSHYPVPPPVVAAPMISKKVRRSSHARRDQCG